MAKSSSLNLRPMPRELKAQFKSYCALRGVSMRDVVVMLVKKLLSDTAGETPTKIKKKKRKVKK